MSDTAIFAASWLIHTDAPPVSGGALLVVDGVVAEIGTLAELRSKHSAPLYEFPGCALLPGFVNAHTHLELSHFPAWLLHSSLDYAPRRFTDWIIQLIKLRRGLTPEQFPASVREGVRMCLESGTTAIGEILSNPALAPLYRQSPLQGRLYFELLGQEDPHFQGGFAAALAACEFVDEQAFTVGLSPHSPYTIAEQYFAQIRDAAAARRLPLSIHVAESSAEDLLLRDGSGDFATDFYPFVGWQQFLGTPPSCSSVELLDRHGLLTPTTAAIHCVHVTENDVRLLRSRGVHVVLCPRSNDLLDVGRAPVALFKKLGIPLALGTDSLASNNSLSLWDEVRFALDNYCGELTAADLLRMVTVGGAAALGVADQCGSLAVGRRADFQVVSGAGHNSATLVEQLMREGALHELYLSGVPYRGAS